MIQICLLTHMAHTLNLADNLEHSVIPFAKKRQTEKRSTNKFFKHKLLYKELQEQIALVLNQLPDRSREIFLLSRVRGLKNREIAEKLQISTTAVEKHIARALQYFSRHFSERYPVDLYIVILAWLMMEQK